MKIVVDFRPFVRNQLIYVYDNEKVIDAATADTDRMMSKIYTLKSRYGVDEITMYGNKSMLEKYKTELLTKYHKEVPITIIERI